MVRKLKFFISLVLIVGFCLQGCNKKNKDEQNQIEVGSVSDLDIEKIMNSPYSTLKPEEQKVKLENQSIDFLNELKTVSSLQAIDAFEYFFKLLDIDVPEIDDPFKEGNAKSRIQLIFDLTNTYGVYTWDAKEKEWTKTNSNSELKLVFPSSSKSTSNNASLSLNVKNSDATITWIYEDYWDNDIYENIFLLPNYFSGILTVDNKQIAKVEVGAEYEKMNMFEIDGETVEGYYPVKTQLKITTYEGFVYWHSVDGTGNDSRIEMQLSKGEKILTETLFAMDIDFKKIVNEATNGVENLLELDKANVNGYMKLMEDLVIIYQIDVANLANEIDRIESQYDSNTEQYCDQIAAALAKYSKVILASIEDNHKIADLTYKTKEDCDWWGCDYYISTYLKFGDGTEVEAEAYFSDGFSKLESTWKDFVKAFER